MTFADLKSSIQSRIWDVLYKNGWREADDFSLNLSEKTAEKIIKRKSQHNLFSIINSVKTNFFKINNVTKKEFTKELVNEIDDLLQLYKPLKINKKKKIRKICTRKNRNNKQKSFTRGEISLKYKHIFECLQCGEKSIFSSLEKLSRDSTFETSCSCGIMTHRHVKEVEMQ